MRPYVIVFSTTTVDGRVASSTGFSNLSCIYDRARLLLLRGYADAVMVGANTVLRDDPRLVKRLRPRSRTYLRVIVDGKLRVHEALRIFSGGPPVVVFTSSAADERRVAKLRSLGADVVVLGRGGAVDLRKALEYLYECYGVRLVLVEGGGILTYNLLREGLVDELRKTETPYVFGAGRSVVDDPSGVGFRSSRESPRLKLACVELCPCRMCVHTVYRVVGAQGERVGVEVPCELSSQAEQAVKEARPEELA